MWSGDKDGNDLLQNYVTCRGKWIWQKMMRSWMIQNKLYLLWHSPIHKLCHLVGDRGGEAKRWVLKGKKKGWHNLWTTPNLHYIPINLMKPFTIYIQCLFPCIFPSSVPTSILTLSWDSFCWSNLWSIDVLLLSYNLGYILLTFVVLIVRANLSSVNFN